ncbi:hypothetical protein ACIRQQ_38965 [Streptomyces fuscichromogenes]|uniref:hypothetical protein n=1 Tax=Streptomyces fuscichromogenes TaxID=1324013 RepID=UPI0038121255
MTPTLELAAAFHQAVLDDDALAVVLSLLHEQTRNGDYAYYTDIAHFMAGLPLETPSPAEWIDGVEPTRQRWGESGHQTTRLPGHR